MTHVNPSFTQQGQRAYADSATAVDSLTGLDTENSDITIDLSSGNVIFILRTELEETAGGAGNQPGNLEYQIGTAGFNAIGTVTTGAFVTTGHACTSTDVAATGNLLTTSAASFVAGVFDNNAATGNISFAGNDHTEFAHAIELVAADLSNGDTLQFRIAGIAAWNNTITVTVQKTTAIELSGSPSMGTVSPSGALAAIAELSGTPAAAAVSADGALAAIAELSGAPSAEAVSADGVLTPASSSVELSGSPSMAAVTASGAAAVIAELSGVPAADAVTPAGALSAIAALSGTPAADNVAPSGAIAAIAELSGALSAGAVTSAGALNVITPIELTGTPSLAAVAASGAISAPVALGGTPAAAAVDSGGALSVGGIAGLSGTPSMGAVAPSGAMSTLAALSGSLSTGVIAASGAMAMPVILSGAAAMAAIAGDGVVSSGAGSFTSAPAGAAYAEAGLSGAISSDAPSAVTGTNENRPAAAKVS